MRKKLHLRWNKFTKSQKYLIVITTWLINLIFYLMVPEGWYVLNIFHLIISGACGGIGAAIYKGDI